MSDPLSPFAIFLREKLRRGEIEVPEYKPEPTSAEKKKLARDRMAARAYEREAQGKEAKLLLDAQRRERAELLHRERQLAIEIERMERERAEVREMALGLASPIGAVGGIRHVEDLPVAAPTPSSAKRLDPALRGTPAQLQFASEYEKSGGHSQPVRKAPTGYKNAGLGGESVYVAHHETGVRDKPVARGLAGGSVPVVPTGKGGATSTSARARADQLRGIVGGPKPAIGGRMIHSVDLVGGKKK